MTDAARAQIRRILDYEAGKARREFQSRQKAVYAEHAAKGLLRSGPTIRRMVREMEEIATKLVSDCVEKVSAVAMDMAAFADLSACIEDFLRFLSAEFPAIIEMANGAMRDDVQKGSTYRAAEALFQESRGHVTNKLELYRFSFTRPSSPLLATSVNAPPPVKKGGRPLAKHWDDMWASIAVALHNGDLEPKTQADIERAMHDWMSGAGHDVSNSTIRGRARRLWDRLSAVAD